MENASKALLIAGGILLAMIILSLIVLVDSSISDMRRTQVNQQLSDELNAFNAQYEAYNKKIMYGTDVISVINKAADNNTLMMYKNEKDSGAVGFVNIIVKTSGYKYKTTAVRWDKSVTPAEKYDITIKSSNTDLEKIVGAPSGSITNAEIGIDKENVLGYWENGILIPNNNFIAFFSSNAINYQRIDYVDPSSGKHWDYYVYSALYNFKKDKFTCSAVRYNDGGRIYELEFTRVDQVTL